MRLKPSTFGLAILGAFCAGFIAAPLLQQGIAAAHAQSSPLVASVVDLAGMKHGDLARHPNPEMNAKGLVVTDNATVGIQSGNVAKHMHPKTDEIQYIIEGSGAMWLGKRAQGIQAGLADHHPQRHRARRDDRVQRPGQGYCDQDPAAAEGRRRVRQLGA